MYLYRVHRVEPVIAIGNCRVDLHRWERSIARGPLPGLHLPLTEWHVFPAVEIPRTPPPDDNGSALDLRQLDLLPVGQRRHEVDLDDIMLLQPLPPPIVRGCMLELQPLPGNRDGDAGRVQLGIQAQIQWPAGRGSARLVLARGSIARLPRYADDLGGLPLDALQSRDGRLQIVDRHVLTLSIDHVRDAPRQRDHAGDLEEVPAIAGQLHRSAGGLAPKHILGDEEHAVQLCGHGRPGLALVVEDGRLEDRGAETQEFVVGVCGGGVATLGCRGIVEDRFIGRAGLVGEGIFKGGGEGVGDLVGGREGYRGEAILGVVSVEWQSVSRGVLHGQPGQQQEGGGMEQSNAHKTLGLEVQIGIEGVHVEMAAQMVAGVRGGQSQEVVLSDIHGGGENDGGGGGVGVRVGDVGSGAISRWQVGRSHRMPSSDSLVGLV